VLTVELIEDDASEPVQVTAKPGQELVDICDEALAPIPFSCRSATCATCQVVVLAGAELLEPPGEEERELLTLLRCPENTRLACQARLAKGHGVLRLKPIGT